MKWNSTYLKDGIWLKGNLHTHSTVSDGTYSPYEVVKMYKEIGGYDFLVLTDHTKGNTVQDTEQAYAVPDFTLIMGREESNGHHIVGIGAEMLFNDQSIGKDMEGYAIEDYQFLIDRIRADGGYAFLPHPHWKYDDYWTCEQVMQLNGIFGLEIINGDRFNGPRVLATDLWDETLTQGKCLWGLANDDFHSAGEFCNAWNMVKAKSKSKSDILEALTKGSTYASNGVSFQDIQTDGDYIIVTCSEDSLYRQCEKTFRFIGEGGKLLQMQIGKNLTAVYRATGDEKYVRVELSLDWGMAAFTQPFFLEQQ